MLTVFFALILYCDYFQTRVSIISQFRVDYFMPRQLESRQSTVPNLTSDTVQCVANDCGTLQIKDNDQDEYPSGKK